jgi:hypothetical protein
MTDGYASGFPIKAIPNPDDVDPEYLAAVTERMRRTRRAVAPNPLAQALYPPLPYAKDADD